MGSKSTVEEDYPAVSYERISRVQTPRPACPCVRAHVKNTGGRSAAAAEDVDAREKGGERM